MEAINKHMRVPERLSVGSGQQWRRGEEEEETTRREEHVPPAFTMQVPDRLTYTSPIRRSYSDQSFGRTPPGTPTKLKQTLARHPSSRGSGRPLLQRSSPSAHTSDPQAQHPPSSPYSLSSPQSFLQTARALGLQASQRLLQAVTQKESWSPEEDGGAAVEFIILRRQVMKMSRRLASLERHSTERRNTEVVLFSLLLSACMLNVWLWIRR
uniref:Mitochondrial fission factor n=1 Tax=Labrus bergylta TaxID=56723 RepID=A0A3Q3EIR0_9LABR